MFGGLPKHTAPDNKGNAPGGCSVTLGMVRVLDQVKKTRNKQKPFMQKKVSQEHPGDVQLLQSLVL